MERQPCEFNDACKYFNGIGCHESTHHLYFPSSEYTTPLERLYRSLDENKVEVCRSVHDELHRTELPPEKPTRDAMIQALGGSMVYISVTKRKQIYGE